MHAFLCNAVARRVAPCYDSRFACAVAILVPYDLCPRQLVAAVSDKGWRREQRSKLVLSLKSLCVLIPFAIFPFQFGWNCAYLYILHTQPLPFPLCVFFRIADCHLPRNRTQIAYLHAFTVLDTSNTFINRSDANYYAPFY